jgi:caffeoyl-CoA O-methyltransferase
MAHGTISLTEDLYQYLLRSSVQEPDLLKRLRTETATLPNGIMQIPPEQGQFLAFLVQAIGARRIIELGVFTGYSSLRMALALPDDGRLLACDLSEEWTAIARRYWKEGGVAHKIDLRLAPAIQTLDALIAAGEGGRYDLVFIDALKTEYQEYFERALVLLRQGGVAAIDNTLWDGRVLDEKDTDPLTVAIREFNARLSRDRRVHLSMLVIGDGMTLAFKK